MLGPFLPRSEERLRSAEKPAGGPANVEAPGSAGDCFGLALR